MAIKGDIDLTTNCDFRHDREDKIKRLESSKRVPWHSKLNSRIHYVKDRHYDVSSTMINDLANQIRIGGTRIVNNPSYELRYNHSTNGISVIYTGITPNAAGEVTDSILNAEDNLSWSTTASNIRIYDDDTNTSSIYYDSIIDTGWDYDHHKYPWKNKECKVEKNPKEYIKTKCYDCGKEYYDVFNKYNSSTCPRCAFIKRFGDRNLLKKHPILPWEEDKNKFNYKNYWGYWRRRRYNTPWIPGEKEEENDSKFTVEDIPWIKAIINYRKREDYIKDLYEEQDYSRYLTNMGWLGLHD